MGAQGKLDKDAGSDVCYPHERPRTPIQRRHARSCGRYRLPLGGNSRPQYVRKAVDVGP